MVPHSKDSSPKGSKRGIEVSLQDVARQILVLHNFAQHLLHIGGVYDELLTFFLRRVEADFVKDAFHERVQTACADVLGAFVYAKSKAGNFVERLWCELQLH